MGSVDRYWVVEGNYRRRSPVCPRPQPLPCSPCIGGTRGVGVFRGYLGGISALFPPTLRGSTPRVARSTPMGPQPQGGGSHPPNPSNPTPYPSKPTTQWNRVVRLFLDMRQRARRIGDGNGTCRRVRVVGGQAPSAVQMWAFHKPRPPSGAVRMQ